MRPGGALELNRIDATFAKLKAAGRTALIPYVMTGDPSLVATRAIMDALVAAGADVIELGVPFSDPMADGPVIQRAGERALAQRAGLGDVLDIVREFRRANAETPIVLMGYANPIEAMGVTAFADRAKASGVDGVLVVDYPPEEATDFAQVLAARDIAAIFLLAPTTTEARIAAVAKVARGYVYYVSLKGVTGAAHIDAADVAAKLKRDPRTGQPARRRGFRNTRRGQRAGHRRARGRGGDRLAYHRRNRDRTARGSRGARRRLVAYHTAGARRHDRQACGIDTRQLQYTWR